MIEINASIERWGLSAPFRISGNTFYRCEMLIVELIEDGLVGRGEATGVGYLGESAETILSDVVRFRSHCPSQFDQQQLNHLLPPGGARNALDCALWELDAKKQKQSVCELAGIQKPKPLKTNLTIGAGTPQRMREKALEYADAPFLKLKLTGDAPLDADRLRAVRESRPAAILSVDANCGYDLQRFVELSPILAALGIRTVEQPFAIGQEPDRKELPEEFIFIGDESVQTIEDLDRARQCFDGVNIKLDKTGGLTHALKMAKAARDLGLQTMVGNMVGTSWSQAAGFVVGQVCDLVDLDGVTFLKQDRDPGGSINAGRVWFGDDVWGPASPNHRE